MRMTRFGGAALIAVFVTVLLAVPAAVTTTSAVGAKPKPTWKTTHTKVRGLPVTEMSKGNVTIRAYGDAKVVKSRQRATSSLVNVRFPGKTVTTAKSSTPATVYEMSLASGMSKADACAFAEGMDPFGCQTSADVDRAVAAGAKTTSSSDFIGSDCFDHVTYEGDGSKHAHACITRYHDAYTTSYRWIANKQKSTAWSVDPGWANDLINGVGVQAKYDASDSAASDWDPFTTETVSSSCKDVTTSAQGKNGFSYSTTETVCPDKLNPWHSPAFQYFGAKWTGDAADEDEHRGVVATSVHKIPRSQGYGYDIGSWIRWN